MAAYTHIDGLFKLVSLILDLSFKVGSHKDSYHISMLDLWCNGHMNWDAMFLHSFIHVIFWTHFL